MIVVDRVSITDAFSSGLAGLVKTVHEKSRIRSLGRTSGKIGCMFCRLALSLVRIPLIFLEGRHSANHTS